MNKKDFLDFKETTQINWTMQYASHIYILQGEKEKKGYLLHVYLCPKKKINFKAKRLSLDEEYSYRGKTLNEAREKMMQAKIFDHKSFKDIYPEILVIDKFSHN